MSKINILCVEDGSINVDNFEECANNGTLDGKVLVYRSGATPPYLLTMEKQDLDLRLPEKDQQIINLRQENAILQRALELTVQDKCKFENLYLGNVLEVENVQLACPKKELWYIEQAKAELESKNEKV